MLIPYSFPPRHLSARNLFNIVCPADSCTTRSAAIMNPSQFQPTTGPMVEEEEAASSDEAIQLTGPFKRTRQHVIEITSCLVQKYCDSYKEAGHRLMKFVSTHSGRNLKISLNNHNGGLSYNSTLRYVSDRSIMQWGPAPHQFPLQQNPHHHAHFPP